MQSFKRWLPAFLSALFLVSNVGAQDARQLVQRAVDAELAANHNDHTPWLYRQVNTQPGNTVKQWVAETIHGDVKRVLERNGAKVPLNDQRKQVDDFVHDTSAQAKQKKAGQHDDQQAEQMMRLLPNAFVWKEISKTPQTTTLHFEPDPNYKPPTYEARVFAAMEGEMTVDNQQFRIMALKGHLVHDVVFGMGMFGRLKQGGSFDMKREQVAPGKWQITATHVHVQGRALLFKTISEEEDDLRSDFQSEPEGVTLEQAAATVMSKPE